MNEHHPFHPIVYVRGFAATQGEIEETVADPYMGFNVGSTKARVVWTGETKRFYFESPLVRLMSDHDYDDVFVDGDDLLAMQRADRPVPYRSIVIYRYYDEASNAFGSGSTPPVEHFAKGLSDLLLRLRDRICENPENGVTKKDFRVYLVAHSMGGLVCRAFLQNPKLGSAEARHAVDKLFTYATPHNGIDLRIVRNVPAWMTFGDVDNFNRERMAKYLALDDDEDVSIVHGFPADRVFNLVGTNPGDYSVMRGLSAWAAGEASDGLVRIQNAVTHGTDSEGDEVASPRAYVHRSHSGHYGIVNSEEGYQNLTRFLFGSLRVDGHLHIDELTLPVEVQKELDDGRSVKASYQIESVVSVRGCQWQMTRRTVQENSAIFRTFDELFPKGKGGVRKPDLDRSPRLFSVFLDPAKSVAASKSVAFAVDLKILVPDYQVDGVLFLKRHYEGGYIVRELIIVEAIPDKATSSWRIRYGFQEDNPGKPGVVADVKEQDGALSFEIPIHQGHRPGVTARLAVRAIPWS